MHRPTGRKAMAGMPVADRPGRRDVGLRRRPVARPAVAESARPNGRRSDGRADSADCRWARTAVRRSGTRSLVIVPLVALALVGASCSGSPATVTTTTGGPGPTATSGTAPGTGVPTTVPGSAVASALTTALDAEHQAKATYDNVVAALGDRGPFANVSTGESKHITTLESLAQKYSVPLPAGPFTGQPSPATLTAACQLGASIEAGIIATYDRLLPQVASSPSLVQAFGNLRSTSQTEHLPAFQHCA